MKAIWLKEQENEQLIISESSIFGSTVLNITPQCAKCSLTTESDAILGKQFICKSHLPQTFDKNEHEIVGKWTTSNNNIELGDKIDFDYDQSCISQHFIAQKLGYSKIALVVSVITKDFISEMYKGELQLNITHPYRLQVSTTSICIGNYIKCSIVGLQGGEKVTWKAQHAILYSGQDTGNAIFQATEQGEIIILATIRWKNEIIPLKSEVIWAGKPTINTDLETSHVMTERTPVIIDASNEFFHYKGGISYAIESEDAEYVTVTETDKKFKVETTIPGNKRGEIKLRLKVSNDCGEVSNLHTIAYDTLPGLEPAKAIDLFSAKEHEFTCGRTYDMVK